jgi:hypothetical protein
MISHSNKFIFVCNMRVASQSISKSLSPISIYADNHITAKEAKTGIPTSPASIRLCSSDHILQQKSSHWEDYFTFAFVRDPYSHFLSTFFYLNKHRYKDTMTFSEYAKLQESTNYSSMSDWDFKGLFDRISDDDGKVIVDFVGRMENMEKDWRYISEKCSLDGIELQHINYSMKGGIDDINRYYTSKEKEIVRKLYHRDFEEFGYDR